MHIDSINLTVPSLQITNEQLLEFIAHFNPNHTHATIASYQKMVTYLLKKVGAKTRYVRNRTNGETAIELLKTALESALSDANLARQDVDLLIYCGVGRRFLEPASAYFVAQALGMKCQCFDVLDACMSWTRALELAYLFLKQGVHQHIVIINAELNFYEHGFPDLCRIQSFRQLEYTFPAYTIGEAVTATVLSASEQAWSFAYDSAPEYADLCAIPLEGFEEFIIDGAHTGMNGVNRFYAFGSKMFDIASQRMLDIIRRMVVELDEPDIWLPHAPSAQIIHEIGNQLHVAPEKIYSAVFPKLGNIVSATIPAAMYMALQENRLQRGHKVVLCPASAGMSFAVVQFVF
jgi:acyl-CoA:acyl-CoA alkyltransferase